MTQETYILAFDIEKAGATLQHAIIGLGTVVMNNKFEVIDTLFIKAYVPSETEFEPRCHDEFWSKYPDKLELLRYE